MSRSSSSIGQGHVALAHRRVFWHCACIMSVWHLRAVAPPCGVGDGTDALATVCTLASGEPCVNIFVGNLAFTTTEQDLRQLFEPYGSVEMIRIMTDRETGRSRALVSSRCRTTARRRPPLTPSTVRPWPAAPLRSTKRGRASRAGSHASRAGKPTRAVASCRVYGQGSLQRVCWAIPVPSTAKGGPAVTEAPSTAPWAGSSNSQWPHRRR